MPFFRIRCDTQIEAPTAKSALANAVAEGRIEITEFEQPKETIIELHILPSRTADGQVVGHARLQDGTTIASATLPTAERVYNALGLNNKDSHVHKMYRQRYAPYKLVKAAT